MKASSSKIIILLSICAFAVIVRLLFMQGLWLTTDEYQYSKAAYEISKGNFQIPTNHWNARIGHTFSIALFYKIFGVNEYSAIGASLLFSALNVLLILLLSKEIFNKENYFKVGAIAAVFYSVIPLNITNGSSLSFSPALTFFMFASIYVFLLGERKNISYYYLVSGLLAGISYLFQVTGVYLFIIIAFYLIFNKSFNKKIFLILFGFIIVFGFENLFYYFETGNFLYRQKVTMDTLFGTKLSSIGDLMALYRFKTLPNPFSGTFIGDSWLLEPFRQILLNPAFSIIFYLFLIISVYLFTKKDKKIILLSLLFWPLFLYFSYGSTNPLSYQPLGRFPRYILPCLIPVSLTVAYGINRIFSEKYTQNIIIVFYIFISIFSISLKGGDMGQRMHQVRFFYQFISENPKSKFITNSGTYNGLDYLSKHQGIRSVLAISSVDFINKIKDIEFIKSKVGYYLLINITHKFDPANMDHNEFKYKLITQDDRKPRKICYVPGIGNLLKDNLCDLSNGGKIYQITR